MIPTFPSVGETDTHSHLKRQVEELKQQVTELQRIQKDYHEVVEHATEVIFKLDNQGNFYFVSAEFKRMLDFSNEEVRGKHFTSIIHPDDLQLCQGTFKVLEQFGRAPSSINFRVRHRNGSYKWVNCSAVCLFDEQGAPSHIIGLAHDVSVLHNLLNELKDSSTALKISEERYRSLFEALGEGAVLLDATGTVIASNRCAERMFHVDRESLLNVNAFSLDHNFTHEDGSPFPVHTHPGLITLKTGESFKEVVMGVQKANAPVIWISINTEPIYYSENRLAPDAVVVSFIDITQAKKDKEALIQNQRLLALESERYIKATKAVAEAVVDAQEKERAEIGFELHDNVNQILSTARLYLDLAVLNEKDRVDLIKRSSEGLAHAVIEIRKISQSLVPASLNDLGLVASIEDLMDNLKRTKQVHAEFYHTGEVESISDKRKLVLFRIIQEQVTNVLKHAEASMLIIELEADSSAVSLSVSDNGKGFDKEKIKKGMGLHNIANRTELFNGKMTLITSPGSGCKLNILIPI